MAPGETSALPSQLSADVARSPSVIGKVVRGGIAVPWKPDVRLRERIAPRAETSAMPVRTLRFIFSVVPKRRAVCSLLRYGGADISTRNPWNSSHAVMRPVSLRLTPKRSAYSSGVGSNGAQTEPTNRKFLFHKQRVPPSLCPIDSCPTHPRPSFATEPSSEPDWVVRPRRRHHRC